MFWYQLAEDSGSLPPPPTVGPSSETPSSGRSEPTMGPVEITTFPSQLQLPTLQPTRSIPPAPETPTSKTSAPTSSPSSGLPVIGSFQPSKSLSPERSLPPTVTSRPSATGTSQPTRTIAPTFTDQGTLEPTVNFLQPSISVSPGQTESPTTFTFQPTSAATTTLQPSAAVASLVPSSLRVPTQSSAQPTSSIPSSVSVVPTRSSLRPSLSRRPMSSTVPTLQPSALICSTDVTTTCQTASGLSCDTIAATPTQCTDESMSSISFIFTASSCSESDNAQSATASCTDYAVFDEAGIALVACNDTLGNSLPVSPIAILAGDTFNVEGSETGSLPDGICCSFFNADGESVQTSCLDSSGQTPLSLEDKFGAMIVESCDGKTCEKETMFTFMISNTGEISMEISAFTEYINGIPESLIGSLNETSLSPGETVSIDSIVIVNTCEAGQYSIDVDVDASAQNGLSCSGFDNFTTTITPLFSTYPSLAPATVIQPSATTMPVSLQPTTSPSTPQPSSNVTTSLPTSPPPTQSTIPSVVTVRPTSSQSEVPFSSAPQPSQGSPSPGPPSIVTMQPSSNIVPEMPTTPTLQPTVTPSSNIVPEMPSTPTLQPTATPSSNIVPEMPTTPTLQPTIQKCPTCPPVQTAAPSAGVASFPPATQGLPTKEPVEPYPTHSPGSAGKKIKGRAEPTVAPLDTQAPTKNIKGRAEPTVAPLNTQAPTKNIKGRAEPTVAPLDTPAPQLSNTKYPAAKSNQGHAKTKSKATTKYLAPTHHPSSDIKSKQGHTIESPGPIRYNTSSYPPKTAKESGGKHESK